MNLASVLRVSTLALAAGLAGTLLARSLASARLPRADFAWVNGAEPSSLDPHQVSGIPEFRLVRALYEGLVTRDPKTAAPIPALAESWEVAPDGRAWTFHLRAGSRWTDGSAVTAYDLLASWRRLLDPRTAAPFGELLHVVRGARRWAQDVDARGAPRLDFERTVGLAALDAHTFVVELEHPADHFLEIAACAPLVALSARALETAQARWGERWRLEWTRPEHLVTNGPYRLIERRMNDRIRLARHEGHWAAGSIAFATIDVLASEHLGTNLNLYLSGEVGLLDEVPAAAIPRLAGRADFHPAPYLATSFLRVNVTRAPLDDRRVRRALALAIDRAAIVAKVTRGGELASWSLVPAILPGWEGAELARGADFERDCEEARALLAQVGGALAPIELHFASQETNRDVCEVLADTWRKELGLDVHLRNQEWKTCLDAQRRLDYQLSRSSWIADYADAANFLEPFAPGAENNRTGWSDARYGELVASAQRARGAERARLLRAAEERLLEELPVIPVYTYAVTSLVDPRLGGYYPNALDEHDPRFWHWRDGAEAQR